MMTVSLKSMDESLMDAMMLGMTAAQGCVERVLGSNAMMLGMTEAQSCQMDQTSNGAFAGMR